MISKKEYEKAKRIVSKFEDEQRLRQEKINQGDILLTECLSNRAANALIKVIGKEEVFVSDVVEHIVNSPYANRGLWSLILARGIGRAIMLEIEPYFKGIIK